MGKEVSDVCVFASGSGAGGYQERARFCCLHFLAEGWILTGLADLDWIHLLLHSWTQDHMHELSAVQIPSEKTGPVAQHLCQGLALLKAALWNFRRKPFWLFLFFALTSQWSLILLTCSIVVLLATPRRTSLHP